MLNLMAIFNYSKPVSWLWKFQGLRVVLLFFICFYFWIFNLHIVLAADWYLDASATGANNGTSWADAWTHPSKIIQDKLQPGDTLWVQGGNYEEGLIFINLTGVAVRIATNAANQAIFKFLHVYNCQNFIIDAFSNGKQMFKFNSREPTLNHAVNLRRSMYITVRGLYVDRELEYTTDMAQQHGIRVWDGCGRVTIDSCVIKNTTGDGINMTQGDYTGINENDYDWFLITNCTIMNVGDDGIQTANHHVTVSNCYIDKNGFSTYFGGHPDGFQLNPDGYKIKIFNNTFRGFNQNIFIEYALRDIFIYNNLLIGGNISGTDRGINHSVRDTFSGIFLIANNLMYNFLTYFAWNGGLPASAIIGNNIFLNCRLLVSPVTQSFLNPTNIYWDLPDVQYYDTLGNPVNTPIDRYAGSSVYTDPKIVSLVTFRLQATSPCIGAGKNLNSYFLHDRAGIVRGAVWDIGPYEYGSGIAAPQNLRIIP